MVVHAPLRAAGLLVLGGLAAAGCTDFASPAELIKPTVLAVIAEPPVVAPGEDTQLTAVVADGSGELTGLPMRWSLVETYRGVPPMGTLTGSTYTAPDPIPALPANAPPIDSVRLEVDTGVTTLVNVKFVAVGAVDLTNPTISSFTVGSAEAAAGPITVARGAALDLAITADPPLTDDARFAWYSSAGEIVKYQSNPTTMTAADDAGAGWLFVVVRDGKGGMAWQGVEITVE